MTTFTALTHLLVQPSGSFAYHLVLLFALGGALQAAWVQWQRTAYPQARRLLTGLLVLVGVRGVYFALGGLAWQGLVSPHLVLPIADRAAGACAFLVFAWLWGFPEHHERGDLFLAGGGGLILLATVASFVIWPYFAARDFNNSVVDQAWTGFNILLGVAGLFILFHRRPNGATGGEVALSVLTLGYLLHALLPPPSNDLDGTLRLAEIIAYPLLFSLPYRFSLPTPQAETIPIRAVHVQQAAPPPLDTAAQQALLELLGTPPNHPETCARIAKAVALLMKADLCLLITPPQDERLSIACAYDLVREQHLNGATFSAHQVPLLVAAMSRRRALRLPASSTSADAHTLASLLNLARSGPILTAPLVGDPEKPVQGSIVLLSSYAQHFWTASEEERLTEIARQVARWLEEEPAPESSSVAASTPPPQTDEPPPEITARVAALEEQLMALNEENAALRARAERAASLEARLRTLTAAQENAPQVREQPAAEDVDVPEPTQPLEERKTAEDYRQNLQVLLSTVQDLRQPLASLAGYADLLLSESVGILGALQRQFVERIRSNATRMTQAINDIIQTLVMETESLEVTPQKIDINEALDVAMSRNSQLFREKRLLLRLDLPNALPIAQLDKEMFHQILHHLLRNAALASPEEGEISLRLQVLEEDGEEERLLLIEVSDSGGGIAPEDIPHVFSRRYRATYRTIAGLGDNGLSMPLVAALVKALHGRLWVESTPGKGATFSILLPLPAKEDAQATPAPTAPHETASAS